MEKIYSKQNRKKLLHVISRRNLKEKRIDILDPKLPLQVSRINLKNCIIKPHANVKKYRSFKEKHSLGY